VLVGQSLCSSRSSSGHLCRLNLWVKYRSATTASLTNWAGVKNLRWHLAHDAIVGTLPSYLKTTKLRSTMTGTGTKPAHLHFIQNVAPAPAKLATVRSNIAIVHQSVLRVFGWTKKSCIGPPFANRAILKKGRPRRRQTTPCSGSQTLADYCYAAVPAVLSVGEISEHAVRNEKTGPECPGVLAWDRMRETMGYA
jgi:hypothetical protein